MGRRDGGGVARARVTPADKRHAILLALRTWPDMSTNRIAEQVGCNQSTVIRAKQEVMQTHNLPDRTIGKDGKIYPRNGWGKRGSRD